jgi:hypothetical protein
MSADECVGTFLGASHPSHLAATALRFLYGLPLKRERFIEMLPTLRKEHHMPVMLRAAF